MPTCARQLDGRKPLHIAQVAQLALRESGRTGPESNKPTIGGSVDAALIAGGSAASLAIAAALVVLRGR